MTLVSDVIDGVLDRLEENVTLSGFWSRAELLVHLNDAMLEFTLTVGQLITEHTYTLRSMKWHALPPGAIALIHVAAGVAGADYLVPIEKTSLESFDQEDRRWERLAGFPKQWAPAGIQYFMTDRHVTSAQDLILRTLDAPAQLAETDVVPLNDEFIVAIEHYVFHAARFKEGGMEFEDAIEDYDEFRRVAKIDSDKTFAQMFTLWSREPMAITGAGYGTPKE